jgi:hypothetical protein
MSQVPILQSDGITRFDTAEPHSGSARGRSATGQLRLPYHLVEPIAFTVDIILVVTLSLLTIIGIGVFLILLGVAHACDAVRRSISLLTSSRT